MKKLSRVLVTGGAGFIGSYLVDTLVTEGYSVVVLDNFVSGKIENLRAKLAKNSFTLIEGDIREKRVISEAMSDIDTVVHLAALSDVERSVKDPVETHDVNVLGTLNVLMGAVRVGVKRFVYASSAAIYGEGNRLPLKEDYQPKPISPYAASKAAAENYCLAFQSYGLQTVILRYFNVYGPRQQLNSYCGVVENFLINALSGKPLVIFGTGEQTRDFIYIEDVVNATVMTLESNASNGKILNVCTGKPTSINQLAEIIQETVGKSLQILFAKPRKGDIHNNYGDPTKAEKTIGFRAKISSSEGLERIVRTIIAPAAVNIEKEV